MKKLILVGNKEIQEDISNIVDKFDYVVRFNRMNNYGKTGTKTDLYIADIHRSFFKLLLPPYDKFLSIKNILITSHTVRNSAQAINNNIFSKEQLDSAIKFDLLSYNKLLINKYCALQNITNREMFTNVFIILNYILEHYSNEYEIYITAIDIDGRGEMFNTNPIWKNSHHQNLGAIEENILKQLINDKKLYRVLI